MPSLPPDQATSETLVHSSGDALKSIEVKDGIARVGSYGIRFSGPDSKDLTGEYFTPACDYGPRCGDGAVTMFNHGFLSVDGLDENSQRALDAVTGRTYGPVKAVKDDVGIFISAVLNLSDEFEAAIAELVDAGKLKWSSGTAAHLMRKSADGEILRWHPIEFSYTPTPAEPRLPAIAPLKSVTLDKASAAEVAAAFAPKPAIEPTPVDSAKTAVPAPTISVITNPPTMTPEEIAAQKAAYEKECNDRVETRTKEVEEIFAVGATFGKSKEASEFVKSGRSLEEFQTEVLKSLNAKPVDPNAGLVGMNAKEQKAYSVIKLINDICTHGRPQGLEKEAHEAAMKIAGRAVEGYLIPDDVLKSFGRRSVKAVNTAGSATAGGYLVDTDMGPMIELLRNKPVVVQAGATTLGGLVGDVVLPVQTGASTAYWVAETAALTDSNATFGQKKLSPKRLGCTIPYSTQLLAQTSLDAEALIRDDVVRVLSLEKDRASLAGTGATGEPLGVELTTGINATVTYGGAAEWADIVEHETGIAVDNADISSMAFIINAATRGKWKTALKIATYGGSGYLIDSNNSANGYPVFVTNQTFSTASQSHFGCWNQLILAMWAGMEMIVDPYALKKSGQVEITFNELCDILVRQPLAFNISTDTAAA
jgi:HK97 family phage major capsid protein